MENNKVIAQKIENGQTSLGLELGSTRIKAVIIDAEGEVLASGGYGWHDRLEDGVWTYHLDDVIAGLQACYADLAANVKKEYGVTLKKVSALGISAMMHGYLAVDKEGKQLASFRTWRNTITAEAAEKLTDLFQYNIPQRWSIAHLYQAILNGEKHVADVDYFSTLSGYVHRLLTGRRVLGVGDAAGMFPIDSEINDYYQKMLDQFDELIAPYGFDWKIRDILPEVLTAGQDAGVLTPEGAALLDPSGNLEAGIRMAPPEGDAGTGMAATNSCALRTGNTSAGTSIFTMVVLEKPLSKVYPEIDMVTTPSGKAVAMVHCNNCTSDINAWVSIIRESLNLFGCEVSDGELYTKLFEESLKGDRDCGGLMDYNYLAGEGITHFDEGIPFFMRRPDANFNLANFMRTHIVAALSTLELGMHILRDENVVIDKMYGHGGYFKTEGVGQRYLAAAIGAPVTVMKTAGEGGAWGMALLAEYMNHAGEKTLEDFLENDIFSKSAGSSFDPDPADVEGFMKYQKWFEKALPVEEAAVQSAK